MKVEQRRRLTDLFARGKFIEVTDGEVTVPLWIRKMTPSDAETAYLKASAKRAAYLTQTKEGLQSDVYVSLKTEIDLLEKEGIASWLVENEIVKRQPLIEARVAYEDEWHEEKYLVSLQNRVLDQDFLDREAENAEDPEVQRVRAELARYQTQADSEVEKERLSLLKDFEARNIQDLRDDMMKMMMEAQADAAWLAEFQRCQVWLCVYDAEQRSEKYFDSRAQVDELQIEVLNQILEAIDEIHMKDLEGKDSQQTQDSSAPAE